MLPHERIIVAMDIQNDKTIALAKSLAGKVGMVKISLEVLSPMVPIWCEKLLMVERTF